MKRRHELTSTLLTSRCNSPTEASCNNFIACTASYDGVEAAVQLRMELTVSDSQTEDRVWSVLQTQTSNECSKHLRVVVNSHGAAGHVRPVVQLPIGEVAPNQAPHECLA